jgi:hypothetical protein
VVGLHLQPDSNKEVKYIIPKNKLVESGFLLDRLHKDWLCNDSRDKDIAIKTWLFKHMADSNSINYCVIDDEKIGLHKQVQVYGGWYEKGFQDRHLAELAKSFGIEWKQDELYKGQ